MTSNCRTTCLYKFIGVSLLAVPLWGCGSTAEQVVVDTHLDRARLQDLRNKKLLLVGVLDAELPEYGDQVDPSTGKLILSDHSTKLIARLESFFEIQEVSPKSLTDSEIEKLRTHDASAIARMAKRENAEGVIVLRAAYGYRMQAGSVLGGIAQKLAEEVSEEAETAAKMAFGPSNVECYVFGSDTCIADAQGKIAWEFHGKVTALPQPFQAFTDPAEFFSDEFISDFAGLDPSARTISRAMCLIVNEYLAYNEWLLVQDFEGKKAKNFSEDYPEEKKTNKHIVIEPASD